MVAQIGVASCSGMITVGMGNDRIIDWTPRIDVKFALRTKDPAIGKTK